MKNKKTTYLLLALVVLIWGVIGFRIYKHVHDSDSDDRMVSVLDTTAIIPDSAMIVELKLDYKDPFLKRNVVVSKTTSVAQTSNIRSTANIRRRIGGTNPVKPEKTLTWPDIQYSGIILNDKTNEELGLIQIGTESFLIREGDVREKIEILTIFADSVIISYEDEKRTFKKTK